MNVKGLAESDVPYFPYVRSQWAEPAEDPLVSLLRDVDQHYDRAIEVGGRGCEAVKDA